ncbi:MAG TPA: amidase family protein [Stellaceae bacterium]|nr:amidase family protein [Stellaceae bacterium]
MSAAEPFDIVETTIAEIHAAYLTGTLTARGLVQAYLDRIAAYDQNGPKINALISLNPRTLDEADRLDAVLKSSGLSGPLHGIPVVIKDQADVKEMPTTLGSVLFKEHMPGRDCFVAARVRSAGAILLGKAALGELGAGDTHGSLFGSTRNPYDLARTVGGSSGGSAASVTANFTVVAIGQEGLASIRRPAIWCGIAGMRPSVGLVSRTGVYEGWPAMNGSLGPMARTVTDMTKLLDVMVGYDADDPATAHGVGRAPTSFTRALDRNALKGARLGILREPMGLNSQPDTDDFAKITEVFDRAVAELRAAGAEIVDPIVIPDLKSLLAQRAFSTAERDAAFKVYFGGSANPPFASRAEVQDSPLFERLMKPTRERWLRSAPEEKYYPSLKARDTLMTNMLKVMADHRLDAIVHKAVEHQPTLISEGVNPPYAEQRGAPHINTFLQTVPSVVVPAGFTRDGLPAGITFLGRPYDDASMIGYAFAYEQATHHRRAPSTTP